LEVTVTSAIAFSRIVLGAGKDKKVKLPEVSLVYIIKKKPS